MKMWGITNTGLVRSENQDAYAAFTVGGYSAAVVCDGMGGTNGGRVASGIAVEQFEKELRAVLQENAGEEQLRQATLYAARRRRTPTISTWAPHWCAPWPKRIW